ncbi:MAG: methyltransferase domain-containing protein [Gaiellaceae bacterium MAG52_C11]|nr:methyltransferase domain-containing protein [Candidatus Gaiellasilicea maunaloa]
MSDAAVWWGEGTYERLAELLSPVHDVLLERLALSAGERFLDVATGTGAVAIRAAHAGADVTACDLAPGMIAKARAEAGVAEIAFDVADARSLPYGDSSFDVVASAFGVVFAPQPETAAAQLARVCRPGGRLGLTTWVPDEEVAAAYEPFTGGREPSTDAWGDPNSLERLLGDSFGLEVERRTWWATGRNGAEVWRLFSTSAPPLKALLESLPEERRPALRNAFVDIYERYRDSDGVRYPNDYLLVAGTRR